MLSIDLLFSFVWIIVGFAAIRLVGQRFFREKYRADIAAIAVVVAFVAGALWHPFHSGNASATISGGATAATGFATACDRSAAFNPHAKPALTVRPDIGHRYNGNLDVLAAEPGGAQTSDFKTGCNIYAGGWVADAAKKSPVPGIVLVVDSREVIDATSGYREPRPDVVKAFGAATMLHTGFSGATIPTTGLAAGPHTIALGALGSDGKSYYLVGTPATVTLR